MFVTFRKVECFAKLPSHEFLCERPPRGDRVLARGSASEESLGNRSFQNRYVGHRKHPIRIHWPKILLEFNEPHINDMYRTSTDNSSRQNSLRPQMSHVHLDSIPVLEVGLLVFQSVCLNHAHIIHHLSRLSSGELTFHILVGVR